MSDILRAAPALDLQSARQAGAAALRQGRAREALACFERIAAAGRADPALWIGMAMARGMLGDAAGELAALQEALKLDPREARALMMCGDHHARAGDDRAAQAYYQAFLSLAPGTNDAALHAEMPRARRLCEGYAAAFGAHFEAAL